MRPIGIMSIPRAQTPAPDRRFDILMGAAGHNTGNLLFTNAVWQQIRGRKKRIGFQFDPEALNASLKALVIPAANWLGPHVDFSDLADLIEQLDIPVVMIGLGAQDDSYSKNIEVPEGTLRFVRAVAARSHSISVRGNYTKGVLEKYGITNTIVTGCPSLYMDLQPNAAESLLSHRNAAHGPILLHSTRYSAKYHTFLDAGSLHLDIFRYAYRSGADLLLQSEPEEISMIVQAAEKPPIADEVKATMVALYGAGSWEQVEAYLLSHAKVYFDVPSWSQAVMAYAGVFGTRLHATIMALNSGIPAVLAYHDSRTQEMCDFARLPSIHVSKASLNREPVQRQIRNADVETYLSTKQQHADLYSQFLLDNSLHSRLTPNRRTPTYP